MNTLHWMGALVLVLCGWCAGETHRRQAGLHSGDLRRAQALLRRIRQEIAYRQAELGRLYRQLWAEGLCWPPNTPDGTLQRMAPPGTFRRDETECFAECMSGLGHTEARQECERLDYYIQRFGDFRQAAEQKEREADALDRKLGLAAGAMLALLFL